MWETIKGRISVSNLHPLQELNDIFACGEIFSEGAWLAQKLEVGSSALFYGKVKLICKEKADSKFPADAVFVCDKAPVTAAVLMDTIS
jgi:hypothetical protein